MKHRQCGYQSEIVLASSKPITGIINHSEARTVLCGPFREYENFDVHRGEK